MKELKNSETAKNLMRAFAGESQARNRYTFAAGQAKKEGLFVIQAIFNYTAGQEKEHAEIFYKYLKDLKGETIFIDGGYPVDLYDNAKDLLKAARHNEYEEYEEVYKGFAETAKQEGFSQISSSFSMISQIEKIHGDRFQMFVDYMEKNQLFVSNTQTGWLCLNCGHVLTGLDAPALCPVCHHEQGYFIRLELSPFTK